MVSDLAGRLLAEGETETPTEVTATELAEWLAAEVERLLRTAGGAGDAARGQLLENVVAVPGVVDPRDGAIRFAPNLPQVEGRQFVEELQARLAGNVSFDNGANLALVGESHYGAAHAVRAAVMFTIGTGVGAGVALDGNLLRGCSGFVGEFGYLTACGSKMTVEDALSGPGLALQARAAGVDATLAADILVDDGSPALSAIREFVVATIAELVLTVTAAYEPEVIVFGGRVAPALATLLAAVTERLAASGAPPPPIVVSELGPAAGPLGAVVAALQNAWLREDVPFADLENMALPAHLSKAVCTFSDPAATVAAGSVSRARPTADAVGAKHEKGKR
jgi:predicted NBD/HSP70 family sugar kinase